MNMADTIKKCRWCGTHPCPYPRDEEFAQQIEEHGKEWLRNMPCWTPIEEELSVVSWTCPYCKRSMYSSWERPDEKMTTCIYCGMVFENPYYREGRENGLRCALCGQRNVDGAIDQFGDFVCVDCFAEGEARFHGRKAEVLAPVPGYNYSGLNHNKILAAWNKK